MIDDRVEAWRRREDALRRLMQTAPASAVERFKRTSYEEVARRAAEIEASLAVVAREQGGASTVSGSEEDDWLTLRAKMEDEGWATIGEMALGLDEHWARRLAAHGAARDDPAREPGIVPGESSTFFPWDAVFWNWCQRRLLHRPVAPLYEPLPKLRRRRAELRARAKAVSPDAREWRLARELTRLFNGHLPWYARVELLPLPDGHALIGRWGLWSSGISSSPLSLLTQEGIVAAVLAVQAFAANKTRRSWPLPLREDEMRRAHRADPDWAIGRPIPNASLSEKELRIWFGAENAPAFELPPIAVRKDAAQG